jgi:hypothetical protein
VSQSAARFDVLRICFSASCSEICNTLEGLQQIRNILTLYDVVDLLWTLQQIELAEFGFMY